MVLESPVVMVVDDSETARRLVRMGLELEGILVVEADSLRRARQYLHPRMAGIVLDRELPDGDGLDLLPDVGATCPEASVVIHSTIDDGRQPAWIPRVEKGDLPAILAALALDPIGRPQEQLVVVDLVRTEADAVVQEWEELCRWDPLLPPDSRPVDARTIVVAVGEALQRPQPLGWGPDPALSSVMERFAAATGAIDVAIGQLVCLREAFRRHLAGHLPPVEEAETRARLDMIMDRATWSAARVAAARQERQFSLDPATGLGNRTAFEHDFERELRRAARYKRGLTIVLVGPRLLDQAHPEAGDEAQIVALASVLVSNIRAQDTAYRVAGATFAVLLPETGSDGRDPAVDRLGRSLGTDVTLGAATFDDDGHDAATLHLAAERAREKFRDRDPSPH